MSPIKSTKVSAEAKAHQPCSISSLSQADLTSKAAAALRTIRKAANAAASNDGPANKKRQLFDSSELLLTVTLSTAAKRGDANSSNKNTIILTLPNPVHCPDTDSGCLITKDLPRAPADYEATAAHYAEQLKLSGCRASLTVLPLRELTVAYMPYEAKRRLCHAYDYFLADVTIVHRLGSKLGAYFGAKNRRKLPMPIDMEARNLSDEINRALRCVRVCLNGTTLSCLVGPISSLHDGNQDQLEEDQRLVANAVSAIEQLASKLASRSGANNSSNITGLYLRHVSSGNVPVFVCDPADSSAPSVVEQSVDAAKTGTSDKPKKPVRDFDEDLAELGLTLWDHKLLAKTVKKKQKRKPVAEQPGKPKNAGKRKKIGKMVNSPGQTEQQQQKPKAKPQSKKKKLQKAA